MADTPWHHLLVPHLLEQGCTLSVCSGGDEYDLVGSTDAQVAIEALDACEGTRLIATRPDGKHEIAFVVCCLEPDETIADMPGDGLIAAWWDAKFKEQEG